MKELYEFYDNLNVYIKKYDIKKYDIKDYKKDKRLLCTPNMFDISFDISNGVGTVSILCYRRNNDGFVKLKALDIKQDKNAKHTLHIYNTFITNYQTHCIYSNKNDDLLISDIILSDIHSIVYYILQSIYDISININNIYFSILRREINLNPIHDKLRKNDDFNVIESA